MKLSAALLALVAPAVAQVTYLTAPDIIWQAPISPQVQGNACSYSPTDLVVCTSGDGLISAFSAKSGTPSTAAWNYNPTPLGVMSSTSGVTFSESDALGSFVVYGTTDLVDGFPVCRIHALSMATGVSLWTSGALVGSCSGTPEVGFDGGYVYVTHNEDMAGTFSVLRGADGSAFFQATDATQLLSPPGIFHKPISGGYEGGEPNGNDILVWGNKPFPGEIGVPDDSASYAFQFPIGFSGSQSGLEVVTLLNNTDFQADAPPLITDNGQSMIWGVSRNSVVAWPSRTFDRDPGGNKVDFQPRGTPASRPIIAKVASSRGLASPVFYTGSAANHFAAIRLGVDDIGLPKIFSKWEIPTGSPVYPEAQVSPDDAVVYAIEELGTVHAIDADTGTTNWSMSVQGFVTASAFAQSPEGDMIYFADSDGIVHAWQVAEMAASVTMAPVTMAPVVPTPAIAPVTMAPVPTPATPVTSAPVSDSTAAPVTGQPVASPTSSAASHGMLGLVAGVAFGFFF